MLTELGQISDRHAKLRGGRPADLAYVMRYMAWSLALAGRRLRSAGWYARAATTGDFFSLIRAGGALISTAPGRRPLRRHLDPEYAQTAAAWLRDLSDDRQRGSLG